jgi:CRISPR-associated protein Cmr5
MTDTTKQEGKNVSQTIEQKRAAFALVEINAFLETHAGKKESQKEFRSYASALPAMIHMNGLGQAAAFCRAKGETYGKLYDILSRWMIKAGQPFAGDSDLLAGVVARDMYTYRVAQAEALALMEWVKKFALAFMVEEEDAPGVAKEGP